MQVADDEYEGLFTVTVEHSFDSGNVEILMSCNTLPCTLCSVATCYVAMYLF